MFHFLRFIIPSSYRSITVLISSMIPRIYSYFHCRHFAKKYCNNFQPLGIHYVRFVDFFLQEEFNCFVNTCSIRLVVNGATRNAQCATFPSLLIYRLYTLGAYLEVHASLFTFGTMLGAEERRCGGGGETRCRAITIWGGAKDKKYLCLRSPYDLK